MIQFLVQNVELPSVIKEQVKEWINLVIESYDKSAGDLNYLFCDDTHILKVNNQYLNHDYYTDIITFDYCTNNIISGDLVISLDTVESNSKLFNSDFNTELHRVIIHGILHLIGFTDATDDEKQQMRSEEDKALSLLSTFH